MRYDEYIKYYDKIAARYAEEKFTISLNTYRANKFLSYLKKSAKILDFGCGPGRDMHYFAEKGYEPIGIDFSSKMIEEAKKRAPELEFVRDDFLKRPIKESFFDGVWARSVFVHLPMGSFSAHFRKIHYILKPKGIVYINMPDGPDVTRIVQERWYGENMKNIQTTIREHSLQQLLESENFEVLENSSYQKNKQTWIWVIARKK